MSPLEGVTPYPAEFIERYRQAGYWEDRTLGQFFDDICQRYTGRTAIVAKSQPVSYAEMSRQVERLAAQLLKFGLKPGDRFVMQLPNEPAFIYLFFALQKLGVIPVMALVSHRYTEISHFLRLSEARGYAFPDHSGDFEFKNLAEQVKAENPRLKYLLVSGANSLEGAISLDQLLADNGEATGPALDGSEVDPLEPALFQLSGGTTGVPKLIPRTHNDYLYNVRASAAVTDIRPDDRLLVALPMSHNFPLACPGMLGFLMHGARVVLSNSTRPTDLLALIQQERVTHLELVPTLIIRLVNEPALADFDLSSLRIINSGGQKLQSEIKRQAEEMIPNCVVQEVFGMAEGLLCYGRLEDPAAVRYETVGRPVSASDEILLLDDEGNPVPDGEIGELYVRGPYTLRGYFRVPEYNARAFTPNGFYRSGDLMRRHPSGNYIVEGRKKDLINRGGEKISAEEIENLILTHPAVFNVACIPVPDPILGERICACVILKPAQSLILADLCQFLLGTGIAKFKLPERQEIMTEFPLSKFGKVAKNVLVQQII